MQLVTTNVIIFVVCIALLVLSEFTDKSTRNGSESKKSFFHGHCI